MAAGRLVGRRRARRAWPTPPAGQRRAEPPRPHAEPAEVLHRVAEVGELPVEDGPEPVVVDEEVAEPEVAVHDAAARSAADGCASSQRNPSSKAGCGSPSVSRTSRYCATWSVARRPGDGVDRDAVDRAPCAAPTCAPRRSRARRALVVAEQLPGDRLALEALHDHARGSRAPHRRRSATHARPRARPWPAAARSSAGSAPIGMPTPERRRPRAQALQDQLLPLARRHRGRTTTSPATPPDSRRSRRIVRSIRSPPSNDSSERSSSSVPTRGRTYGVRDQQAAATAGYGLTARAAVGVDLEVEVGGAAGVAGVADVADDGARLDVAGARLA